MSKRHFLNIPMYLSFIQISFCHQAVFLLASLKQVYVTSLPRCQRLQDFGPICYTMKLFLTKIEFWEPQKMESLEDNFLVFPRVGEKISFQILPSLKLTANAPENRPGPKRKLNSFSNHPFLGANLLLVSGRVYRIKLPSFIGIIGIRIPIKLTSRKIFWGGCSLL